jgi:hypothetical protein
VFSQKKEHALDKQSASSCPSSAPNSPRPTPALPSESAPRTRTRLPCTPALAASNRISGRARSPRTSPPARAMGRQRARPSPCPATQGTAPPTSAPTRAPIPRACTAGATPCHAYRVSLPPITRRLPSPPHRSERAPKASCTTGSRHQRRKPPPAQVKLAFNPTYPRPFPSLQPPWRHPR